MIRLRMSIAAVWLLVMTPILANSATPTEARTAAAFDDSGWQVQYHEPFDSAFDGVHNQRFGTDNWLQFVLLNGGEITIENGYAQLNAPEFWHAALIRSTNILPADYKLRTKIGFINYDLTEYEQADFDHPDFNSHGGNYENGMYFLTVTNDTCIGDQCAEEWWHYHRKMVIDVDNHIEYPSGDTIQHPVYMVWMGKEYSSIGNELRTWDGIQWDSSAWNWNVAYTYEYETWYYAEMEKANDSLVLRLYAADSSIIEETAPVPLDLIFAMDDTTEYFYVGEPHTDDYEGDVRIDEITLLIRGESCCNGDGIRGNVDGNDHQGNEINIIDVTYLVTYLFADGDTPSCEAEADVDGSDSGSGTAVNIVDLTYLVAYLFSGGPTPTACP